MTNTTTYTVTLPTGATATRKSARTYTHAVITGTPVAYYEAGMAAANGSGAAAWYQSQIDLAVNGYVWGVVSWCGRHDLAEKAARTAHGRMPTDVVRIVGVNA